MADKNEEPKLEAKEEQKKVDNFVEKEVGKNVKTFTFSKEELSVLEPRQSVLAILSTLVNDHNFVTQSYILQNVLPRLGIDPTKEEVNFDITKGTITTSPKVITPAPPEIIKPK